VAWSEVAPPNYFPSQGVYYSVNSGARGSWSPPEVVAGEHYTLPRLALSPDGAVHMIYQGDVSVGGRYYRRLPPDGSGVWSPDETILPAGEGGMSGEVPMAFDSGGNVHVATAADVGIRHVVRSGAGWSTPVDLSVSLKDLPNTTGSIEQPALTVARGNQAVAGWEFDFHRIYLTRSQLAAKTADPVTPISRPTSLAVATAPAAATAATSVVTAGAPTAMTAQAFDKTLDGPSATTNMPMLVALITSALVVGAAVLYSRRRM
jgi:hypothetical protein